MNIKPEGFKELIDYLSDCENQESKASDIQETLKKKHGFTPGKITGIIHRAEAQSVIYKIARGYYKLNRDVAPSNNKINNIDNVIELAISDAIHTIQNVAGKNISNISAKDLEKIKSTIEQLKKIKAM